MCADPGGSAQLLENTVGLAKWIETDDFKTLEVIYTCQ
jgi:hypothetical protein